MKNYPNTCPSKVHKIAARAQRLNQNLYVWADYNDLNHCMAIFWTEELL